MKRTIPIAAIVLLLAGCGSTTRGVDVRTVEVPVTRVEKCVERKDIPRPPAKLGKRPSKDARVLADLLYAKVLAWESFGGEVTAVMKGCVGD